MTLIDKELKEIARIIAGLERAAEENDPDLDKQLEKINEIFSDFHKKYPKLSIKLEKTIDNIFVRIFINEESVKKVFDETASKLKGLVAIGINSFEEATIKEGDKFATTADKIKDKVLLTYAPNRNTENLVLQFDDKEEKVEINFEIKSLLNPMTPEFQIIKQYASREIDENIDLLKKCYGLGFIDIEDDALFEWEDEFYPKMLE